LSIKPPAPQFNICKLHRGLYALANQEGIVDLDLEKIRRAVFPDSETNVKYLLTKLELNGNIVLNKRYIKLTPWPKIGCAEIALKNERFEREPWKEPQSIQPPTAGKDAAKRQERLLSKSGLTGFNYPPAYTTFLKSWPNQPIRYDQNKFAWREWQALDRAQALPDISLLVLILKTSPPGPKTWPGTWLKHRPWKKPHTPIACVTCNDERIIYGTRPDGTKGAVTCPKCTK
jgi:hypothetical protein